MGRNEKLAIIVVPVVIIAMVFFLGFEEKTSATSRSDIQKEMSASNNQDDEHSSMKAKNSLEVKNRLKDLVRGIKNEDDELVSLGNEAAPVPPLLNFDSLSEEEQELQKAIGEAQWKEMRYALEDSFQREPPNTKWTEKVERVSYELLDDERFSMNELEHVDCRTSLCKVVFLNKDEESRQTFQVQSGEKAPWGSIDVHGFSLDTEGGELKTVIYFSNETYTSQPFKNAMDTIAARVEQEINQTSKN